MWPLKKSSRRLAMRADAAEAQSAARSGRRNVTPAIVVAGVFFLIATAILYYPSDRVPYRVGDKALVDLRSPVNFVVENTAETQRKHDEILATTGAVLVLDNPALVRVASQLNNLLQNVRSSPPGAPFPPEVTQAWPALTPQATLWLRQVNPTVFMGNVDTLASSLRGMPLVDQAQAAQIMTQQSDLVYLAETSSVDKVIGAVPRAKIIPLRAANPARREYVRHIVAGAFPLDMVDTVTRYLLDMETPTYRYDAKLSEEWAASNAAAVRPDGLRINQGDTIIAKGQLITPEIYQRLNQAQGAYEHLMAPRYSWLWWVSHLAQALTAGLITVIGTLYITQMNRSLSTASRGWSLAALLLISLLIAKVSVSAGLSYAVYMFGVAPTLLTTIILVIAFNQRLALVIASLHALLVTLALGQGADFFLTILAGITVFTFGLKEIRTRAKLIEMGAFASAVLMVSVWALGLARLLGSVWTSSTLPLTDLTTYLHALAADSLWAALAGVTVGFVTLGILSFIESSFKITTAMKLLELCDLNQPLLRRLSQEASGTFNHALLVGTLAEGAGNAIGANGLLCRAGAYYHDIGKLSKPQYFIENQSGGPNRHEKLSPAMSLLIIVGHVKDGIELAREYHLPWAVHQFIAQHHGTTLVEYFYHAAREQMARTEGVNPENRNSTNAVTEAEFRYPGPKPQTRETAILMICDGAESAVRALSEPTPGRIESVVHQLVMKRLMDGQFSECDLTLRDLGLIEQSLAYTLASVYHGRVPYPKPMSVSRTA